VPLDTYHAAIEVTLTETWENTDGWHGTTVKHYWVVKGIGVVRTAVSATSADGQNHNQTSASYTASLARWSS
jgi:hypothetical protein